MPLPTPGSPDFARPPQRLRTALAKHRLAPNSIEGRTSSTNGNRLWAVAAWQQQGAQLRQPDVTTKRLRLSDDGEEVALVPA